MCATEVLLRLPNKSRRGLCVGMLALVGMVYSVLPLAGYWIPYWWPASFIAAPLLAAVLSGRGAGGARRATGWVALAWACAAIAEILGERYGGIDAPVYARVSVWLGSVGLSGRSVAPWLEHLGRRTLGVFVLHKYVVLLLATVLPVWSLCVGGMTIRLDKAILLPLTVVFSLGLVAVLRRTPLRAVL
jgi:hypothetical protein